jgi:cyclic pyranopterin phosphate synthase
MIDGFDRKITYLRVSVTDRCNLRCRYCMPEEGIDPRLHSDILTFEEIAAIVTQAVALGVRKVRVTGGEPLVRRGVVNLCRSLKAIDGLEELAITTNGLLLEQYAQELKDAGVDRVNLSLDTLNADKYRSITRGGDLNQALQGLEAARQAGLTPLKLNAVLIGGFNDDEIPAFVDLTRSEDLEVRFIELMPLGPGAAFPPEAAIPAQVVLDRVPELEPVGNGGVARLYRLPGGKGKVGLITPVSHDFCSRCDKVRLTADGKLKPCLHSDREIPLRGLTGDALRAALIEGIQSKPAQHPDFNPGQATAGGRSMNRIGG